MLLAAYSAGDGPASHTAPAVAAPGAADEYPGCLQQFGERAAVNPPARPELPPLSTPADSPLWPRFACAVLATHPIRGAGPLRDAASAYMIACMSRRGFAVHVGQAPEFTAGTVTATVITWAVTDESVETDRFRLSASTCTAAWQRAAALDGAAG